MEESNKLSYMSMKLCGSLDCMSGCDGSWRSVVGRDMELMHWEIGCFYMPVEELPEMLYQGFI